MYDILGYDCDYNEIEEFRVLRFPDSECIENWDEAIGVDPRFYCLVRNSNGLVYAISIYDDYHRDFIKRHENINKEERVPTIIKSVSEMQYYQVSFNGITGLPWYYEWDKKELRKKLDVLLKERNIKTLTKKVSL